MTTLHLTNKFDLALPENFAQNNNEKTMANSLVENEHTKRHSSSSTE